MAPFTSWIFLILAIGFEVAGTTSMKMADGFTRLVPSIAVFAFYGFSLAFLTLALKRIDVSVAYAVWSGLGVVAISIIGVMAFSEAMTIAKGGFIGLIIIGVVGLNLTGGAH